MHRAVIIAAVLLSSGLAAASPSEDLDRARDQFRSGDYADAAKGLAYLLYPPPARLAQPSDLIEAHVLFGACAFETGDQQTAQREFEEALSLSPGYTLDRKIFSDGAVAYFDATKRQHEDRIKHDADARALAEEKEKIRLFKESLVVYEVRPYYVNFIPFGAGQFQNGHRSKGLWFASTEATTGAISAGIWIYLVGTYGFNGRVPPTDASFARTLQQVEIGAGGVCLGLMAWGIVDSLLNYHPRARVEGDDSLLPPDLRPAKPAPKTPESSFYITPAVIPDGAGVVLTWER